MIQTIKRWYRFIFPKKVVSTVKPELVRYKVKTNGILHDCVYLDKNTSEDDIISFVKEKYKYIISDKELLDIVLFDGEIINIVYMPKRSKPIEQKEYICSKCKIEFKAYSKPYTIQNGALFVCCRECNEFIDCKPVMEYIKPRTEPLKCIDDRNIEITHI